MRIAMISEHASPLAALGGVDAGGQNLFVAQMAREITLFGHEVDVFTRRDDPSLPEIAEVSPGLRVVHVDAGPPEFVAKEEMLPFMAAFADEVCRHARERHYDVVHANFFMSGHVACMVKDRLGIPFAVTFHALGEVRRKYQGAHDGFPHERTHIERETCSMADMIIAECPQDRQDLLSLYNAQASSIQIVPCGFDPAMFSPIDRALARELVGVPDDVPVILHAGHMVEHEGIENVIRALALMTDGPGSKAILLVVGGETRDANPFATPEIGRLITIAQKLGVRDRVIFTGRKLHTAMPYYYSAANVFVSTPWYEPFGITPLEAMGCGVPVVGSRVGGIKYTVLEGKTGFLVTPRDPGALAQRLTHLIENPMLAEHMGREGRNRALTRFTWRAASEKLLESLARCAGVDDQVLRTEIGNSAALRTTLHEAAETLDATASSLLLPALAVGRLIQRSLEDGAKILVAGNGGSAADAQHFVAELVGRFELEGRPALPAISLAADPAILTGWANDAGFEDVFSRQVSSLGREGDVFLALSTSGNSPNICRALKTARRMGMTTIALLGGSGGRAAGMAEHTLIVPSARTARIHEMHGLLLHVFAEFADAVLQRAGTQPVAERNPVRRLARVI
jgi:D-inositol-3-phosphate glycosyltransferase